MYRILCFSVLASSLLLAPSAGGATLLVNPNGTGDYPTIQAAIDAASSGDIIELGNGTFAGEGNNDVSLDCTPPSGILPFDATFSLSVNNNYDGLIRRMALRLDVHLANETYFRNWFAGNTNIAAGGLFEHSFVESIPFDTSVAGINEIVLVMEDVTPAPYNQPPYPAAGDTATAQCTVVGNAP